MQILWEFLISLKKKKHPFSSCILDILNWCLLKTTMELEEVRDNILHLAHSESLRRTTRAGIAGVTFPSPTCGTVSPGVSSTRMHLDCVWPIWKLCNLANVCDSLWLVPKSCWSLKCTTTNLELTICTVFPSCCNGSAWCQNCLCKTEVTSAVLDSYSYLQHEARWLCSK